MPSFDLNRFTHASSRRRKARAAMPEVLETKAMLSNVSVELTGGDLVIRGDTGDNNLQVSIVDLGESNVLWVEGFGSTQINGAGSNSVRHGVWVASELALFGLGVMQRRCGVSGLRALPHLVIWLTAQREAVRIGCCGMLPMPKLAQAAFASDFFSFAM